MNYKQIDYTHMANERKRAFKHIAERLGKEHAITKMMGSRAWGRHRHEQGADTSLRTAITEMAALEGAFDVLNTWARDNDTKAQNIMLEEWPRGYAESPASNEKAHVPLPTAGGERTENT